MVPVIDKETGQINHEKTEAAEEHEEAIIEGKSHDISYTILSFICVFLNHMTM